MPDINRARQQYLQRHAITPWLTPPVARSLWKNVLVIPAYRESPGLVDKLCHWSQQQDTVLVILVLNRPEHDTNAGANQGLRERVAQLAADSRGDGLYELSHSSHIMLLDMENHVGPTPQAEGVGAARKAGCDTALSWIDAGAIASHWIGCTDADAQLPTDYFDRLPDANNFSAAVYPFTHQATPPTAKRQALHAATALYEFRLHQYVLGLEYAGSPYAFHSLGSAMAVTADGYAKVRGFPKRAGAEDFYLLNKLAKIKSVKRLDGACIELKPRTSTRVPFGTGPGVNALLDDSNSDNQAIFYHPQIFEALRAFLRSAPKLSNDATPLSDALLNQHLAGELSEKSLDVLVTMNIDKAINHCRHHSSDGESFLRHFHQWFDGFRTLKFIHALQEMDYPKQTLSDLQQTNFISKFSTHEDAYRCNLACYQHWQWHTPD